MEEVVKQIRPLKQCGPFRPGHQGHWIQSNLSNHDAENRPLRGRLIDVQADGILTLEMDGQQVFLWNHEPERLIDVIDVNGPDVSYQERWGLVRSPHDFGYLFCVVRAEADRLPCPEQPPTGDPVQLLKTAGGFTISPVSWQPR
jgi:hypothetical protein